MTAPVRPDALVVDDRSRITANVQKMRSQGATDAEVEHYLQNYEGLKPHEPLGPRLRGIARSFGQGLTFGFGEELEAAAKAFGGGPGGTNPALYVGERDAIRGEQHAFEAAHPKTALASEIAGGIASAAVPVGGVLRAAGALPRIGRAAKVGATTGALYGFGKGEGDVASQAKSTAEGAVGGMLLGGAFQGAGEAARKVGQAIDASPRAANAIATVVPRLRPWANRVLERSTDRAALERITAGQTTPGAVAQRMADTPEHIPVAVVDFAGEDAREAVGAIKRLPGPQKNEITQQLRARDSNAPEALRRTIRENTENVAGALGLDPTKVDTRTANPNEVVRLAREALGARSDARFKAVMDAPTQYTPARAARLAKLLERPSLRKAERVGGALARESGETVPPIRIRMDEAESAAGPTVRQLHYLKMGLDEQINALENQQAAVRGAGTKPGATNTKLAKLVKTKRELVKVIDQLSPEYSAALRAHAEEASAIGAFQQGRRIPIGTDAEELATRAASQPNANARTALGAGMTRRIGADLRRAGDARTNPAKTVVGSGSALDNKVQNLRLATPKGAPKIEAAADAVEQMRQTSQRVLGGSPTTERALMNASLAQKAKALVKLVGGRPLAAAHDILSGTYGPQARRTAEKLLLGAKPGERARAIQYLRDLETSATAQSARRMPRLHSRGVGTLSGLAGGTAGAEVSRR